MKQKPKKYKPILGPELEAALKGFVPVFGNPQDYSIVQRLSSLKEKLSGIDGEAMRKLQKKDPRELSKKMKDVLYLEQGLITEITNRNMDF